MRGIDRITTPAGAPVSESTALLTFYNDTTTESVINNGPMRLVDRTGTGAIYFGSGNSDFGNPDTFKKRTAVQSFTLRHQVVIDTSTGYFTTTFEITITSAKVFQIDGKIIPVGPSGRRLSAQRFRKANEQVPRRQRILPALRTGWALKRAIVVEAIGRPGSVMTQILVRIARSASGAGHRWRVPPMDCRAST